MLYKYFPESRSSFFLKPMLRFTPPDELNDPFECRSAYKQICSPALLDAYIHYKKTGEQHKEYFEGSSFRNMNEFGSIFDQFWDENNIENSEKSIRKANEEFAEKLGVFPNLKNVGILSFSRDHANPTMWAHYASSHAGFVIEFHENHDFFQKISKYDEFKNLNFGDDYIQNTCHQTGLISVQYCDELRDKYAFDLISLKTIVNNFATRKANSWDYEKEIRLIKEDIYIYNDYGIVGLVDCPVETIKAVYIGLKSSEKLKNVIYAFHAKYPSIAVKEAFLSKNTYQIRFKDSSPRKHVMRALTNSVAKYDTLYGEFST